MYFMGRKGYQPGVELAGDGMDAFVAFLADHNQIGVVILPRLASSYVAAVMELEWTDKAARRAIGWFVGTIMPRGKAISETLPSRIK